MLSIDNAKKQASTLADYLLTVGKKLKHTHALEAIARINGYKTWNEFQAGAAPTTEAPPTTKLDFVDLGQFFARDDVVQVRLNGHAYAVRHYDYDMMCDIEEIVEVGNAEEMEDVCLELVPHASGALIEVLVTVEQLSKIRHQAGQLWVMDDGTSFEIVLLNVGN